MALLQSVCNGYGRRFAVKGIPFMGSLFYIYPKIAVCALRCCGMFAALLAIRQQRNGRPSAAVGADLSCPHIRKHTRNGDGKCRFGNANMHFW